MASTAKFSIESVEVNVFCPHCSQPAKPPKNPHAFVWSRQDLTSLDIPCAHCGKSFRLPAKLMDLLMSETRSAGYGFCGVGRK